MSSREGDWEALGPWAILAVQDHVKTHPGRYRPDGGTQAKERTENPSNVPLLHTYTGLLHKIPSQSLHDKEIMRGPAYPSPKAKD